MRASPATAVFEVREQEGDSLGVGLSLERVLAQRMMAQTSRLLYK